MSALGQKQTLRKVRLMSALPQARTWFSTVVMFALCQKQTFCACSNERRYSITSSAMESTPAGIVRPSVFAVLRLMINSNLVDCRTGKSAGFAPLRI